MTIECVWRRVSVLVNVAWALLPGNSSKRPCPLALSADSTGVFPEAISVIGLASRPEFCRQFGRDQTR